MLKALSDITFAIKSAFAIKNALDITFGCKSARSEPLGGMMMKEIGKLMMSHPPESRWAEEREGCCGPTDLLASSLINWSIGCCKDGGFGKEPRRALLIRVTGSFCPRLPWSHCTSWYTGWMYHNNSTMRALALCTSLRIKAGQLHGALFYRVVVPLGREERQVEVQEQGHHECLLCVSDLWWLQRLRLDFKVEDLNLHPSAEATTTAEKILL